MSSPKDRELFDALTQDLRPVRRAPAFAVALSAVLGVALLCGVALRDRLGPLETLWQQILGEPLYAAVLLALLIAGVAGSVAAVASSAPDRSRLATQGSRVAWASLGLAVVGCSIGVGLTPDPSALGAAVHASCFVFSVAVALVPGAALAFCTMRGWVARPSQAASAALVGVLALGAVLVHLQCAALEPAHFLLGHLTAPVALSALGLVPLAALLRRFAR